MDHEPIFYYDNPKKERKNHIIGWIAGVLALLTAGALIVAIFNQGSPLDDEVGRGTPTPVGQTATPAEGATPDANATTPPAGQTPAPLRTVGPVVAPSGLEELYDTVAPAVVTVNNYVSGRWGDELSGLGSGVVISAEGYIITNYHVVKDADKLTVTFSDGREHDCTLIGGDERGDIAVVKVSGRENLQVVNIGDSDELRPGRQVCAIGSPDGLEGTLTLGIISGPMRSIVKDNSGVTIRVLQTDTAINPGNSGGALLNMAGQLIGIPTLKTIYVGDVSAEGLGFCIPINDAMRIAEDIIATGAYHRAFLGVTGRDVTEREVTDGLPLGCYATAISPNSAAAEAGLKTGDVITGLDGMTIQSQIDLYNKLSDYRPGQTVTLTVYRNGETMTFTATLKTA